MIREAAAHQRALAVGQQREHRLDLVGVGVDHAERQQRRRLDPHGPQHRPRVVRGHVVLVPRRSRQLGRDVVQRAGQRAGERRHVLAARCECGVQRLRHVAGELPAPPQRVRRELFRLLLAEPLDEQDVRRPVLRVDPAQRLDRRDGQHGRAELRRFLERGHGDRGSRPDLAERERRVPAGQLALVAVPHRRRELGNGFVRECAELAQQVRGALADEPRRVAGEHAPQRRHRDGRVPLERRQRRARVRPHPVVRVLDAAHQHWQHGPRMSREDHLVPHVPQVPLVELDVGAPHPPDLLARPCLRRDGAVVVPEPHAPAVGDERGATVRVPCRSEAFAAQRSRRLALGRERRELDPVAVRELEELPPVAMPARVDAVAELADLPAIGGRVGARAGEVEAHLAPLAADRDLDPLAGLRHLSGKRAEQRGDSGSGDAHGTVVATRRLSSRVGTTVPQPAGCSRPRRVLARLEGEPGRSCTTVAGAHGSVGCAAWATLTTTSA